MISPADRPPSSQPSPAGLPPRRRLAVVLVADVVGYTRLMQADENETHRRMMALRSDVTDPEVDGHGGEIVKNTGDGFFAVFESVDDAVHCAICLQKKFGEVSKGEPESRKINFRIGINLAEIIFDGDDIYGDGVNIAVRLQSYAEPGGIVVSQAIVDQFSDRSEVSFADLGDLPLRNILRPVRAFSLRIGDERARASGEAIPGTEPRPSIVVLPFTENPVSEGGEYFAEGIVDDIIHGLSGLRELFVISRGSSLGYRGPGIDVRKIGRELGVRYVLQGSVRRAPNRLQIRTELCNAETGIIVRSDRYDGVSADLFDLQSKIGLQVVSAIAPQIRERERLRAMRKHPQNMTAYDFVLQALGPLFNMNYDAFSLARGLLQQAIANDPDYGPAHSYAAYWHVTRVGQGWSPDPAADTEEAARLALAAIERDSNDALALAIYGHVQSYLLKEYDKAIELQDRAIEVGPNCAMAWTLSSVTHGYVGNGSLAVMRADQGLQLSPRGPHVFFHEHLLSQAHYVNGNYDDAARWAWRAYENNERFTSNLRCLIASLVAIGEIAQARRIAQRLLSLDPGFTLAAFASRTPLNGAIRDKFVERLRASGLPD